jgi:hypothetical protein
MIGKLGCRSLLVGCILVVSAPAGAQVVDFSGPWAVNGQIVVGPVFTAILPICRFTQVANQLSGSCQGVSLGGPASGASNGPMISWQWQAQALNPLGVGGIASFQGTLGPDNIIRGTWTSTAVPGASGTFSAHRP